MTLFYQMSYLNPFSCLDLSSSDEETDNSDKEPTSSDEKDSDSDKESIKSDEDSDAASTVSGASEKKENKQSEVESDKESGVKSEMVLNASDNFDDIWNLSWSEIVFNNLSSESKSYVKSKMVLTASDDFDDESSYHSYIYNLSSESESDDDSMSMTVANVFEETFLKKLENLQKQSLSDLAPSYSADCFFSYLCDDNGCDLKSGLLINKSRVFEKDVCPLFVRFKLSNIDKYRKCFFETTLSSYDVCFQGIYFHIYKSSSMKRFMTEEMFDEYQYFDQAKARLKKSYFRDTSTKEFLKRHIDTILHERCYVSCPYEEETYERYVHAVVYVGVV